MEERWPRSEPVQSSREERRFSQRCNMQPAFTVWWMTLAESRREADLGGQTNGVVCGLRQVSLHEVRKKQQQEKNARDM